MGQHAGSIYFILGLWSNNNFFSINQTEQAVEHSFCDGLAVEHSFCDGLAVEHSFCDGLATSSASSISATLQCN